MTASSLLQSQRHIQWGLIVLLAFHHSVSSLRTSHVSPLHRSGYGLRSICQPHRMRVKTLRSTNVIADYGSESQLFRASSGGDLDRFQRYGDNETFVFDDDWLTLLEVVDELLIHHYGSSRTLKQKQDTIISEIQKEHLEDSVVCDLIDGGYTKKMIESLDVPIIWIGDGRAVLQTLSPVFEEKTVALLREVATRWWDKLGNDGTSRFTYQRKGNSEAHLLDLVQFNSELQERIDKELRSKIYPLVEEHFLSSPGFLRGEDDGTGNVPLKPRIYDSIIIRYNATEANENDLGAGQPLHRDMGLVSVNIMLNDDYKGGGTLMELQLDGVERNEDQTTTVHPLKPLGVGHALMHYSHERHAGAGTTEGVRDILVLFLTATREPHNNQASSSLYPSPLPASRELAARLKNRAGLVSDDFWLKALYHRMALDVVSEDGEAWHFLGLSISKAISGAHDPSDTRWSLMATRLATAVLDHATSLTPNDARLYNNLALLVGRIRSQDQSFSPNILSCVVGDDMLAVIRALYEKSLRLHEEANAAGCDVIVDYQKAILNYGLFLSNQDLFAEAATILEKMDIPSQSEQVNQVHRDTNVLLKFCQKEARQAIGVFEKVVIQNSTLRLDVN